MKAPTGPVPSRTIQLFDRAPRGDRFHVRARWWTCPLPAIERHVPEVGHVLELGCGHGLLSFYLALSSTKRLVTGIDIDRHKIELANRAAEDLDPGEAHIEFEAVDSGVMPDGPFDAIVINDVLYLMPDERRRAALAACVERLAPDGVLLVKELDVVPRWKYRIGHLQELLATRVLRYTQGEQVEIQPLEQFAAVLTGLGLDVHVERIDRGYVHSHALLVGRPSRSST